MNSSCQYASWHDKPIKGIHKFVVGRMSDKRMTSWGRILFLLSFTMFFPRIIRHVAKLSTSQIPRPVFLRSFSVISDLSDLSEVIMEYHIFLWNILRWWRTKGFHFRSAQKLFTYVNENLYYARAHHSMIWPFDFRIEMTIGWSHWSDSSHPTPRDFFFFWLIPMKLSDFEDTTREKLNSAIMDILPEIGTGTVLTTFRL
jgi:hypothetical protein